MSEADFTDESREIIRLSAYAYANAIGINMKGLITNRYVDPLRSRCNNFNIMMEHFDIEVTRACYIREFYEHIINNGAFMSPRYLILIADFVTGQGFLIPVTSRGAARQNIGSFAKASFENAMATFISGACGRKEEKTKSSVSTSIFVGTRAVIGTGLCQPVPDKDMLEDIRNSNRKKQQEELLAENEDDDDEELEFEDEENVQPPVQELDAISAEEIGVILTELNGVNNDAELGGGRVVTAANVAVVQLCPKQALPRIPKVGPTTMAPLWIQEILLEHLRYSRDLEAPRAEDKDESKDQEEEEADKREESEF
jgi:hypothetical protein